MPVDKGNRVVINVWFSEADGGFDVGHASIHIPSKNSYISLWPAKASEKLKMAFMFFEHRDKVAFHSYEQDIEAEGRKPEFVCCLYTLNIDAIVRKFHALFPMIKNWSALGNTKLNRPNPHMSHSCSGLAYDLLIAGGIRQLAWVGITTPITPSPHNIFTMARSAKEYEVSAHSDTQRFDEEDDYQFDPHEEISTMAIVQAFKTNCVVM